MSVPGSHPPNTPELDPEPMMSWLGRHPIFDGYCAPPRTCTFEPRPEFEQDISKYQVRS